MLFGLQVAKMLKRFSSTIKRNKVNGEVKQNGVAEAPSRDSRKMSNFSKKNGKEKHDHSANRSEVEGTFEQYARP